jgi:hypothetical protein
MRTLLALSTLLSLALVGCGPDINNACGLTGGIPSEDEAPSGRLVATLDGQPFSQAATWSDGPNGSLDSGTLTAIITVDQSGTDVPDLIGRRAFPICVPLGERSETSGQATFDGSFVTNASNTGNLSILDEADGIIVGRIAVTLGEAGGDTHVFADGAFRATLR